MLHIDPPIYLFAALLLLTVPLPWLIAAFFAAAVHEMAHLAMILITGGSIQRISISITGARIHAFFPSNASEFVSSLAGPAGSLLLLLTSPIFPRLSLCGMIQGLFNLIPIYPLDGGRMLKSILTALFPAAAAKSSRMIDYILTLFFLAASVFAAVFASAGPIPVVIFSLFLYNRKKTCKQTGIGIQ